MAEGTAPTPLDAQDLEARLAPLVPRQATGLVLAVSGGPDSICLMRLAADLVRRQRLPPVTVATVDHGLRPGSGHDAAFVLSQAAAIDLPAQLLVWTGEKPVRALQEKARAARYALLVDLCLRLGADHLLTAHTLDDQAETVLFRLARGSGPAGLAGMQARSTLASGVAHVRPLLAIAKARLVATCAAQGWPSVIDPSNEDPRFARTRLRRLAPALAEEGLDARRLSRLAARVAQANAALAHAADLLSREAIRMASPDLWQIDLTRLLAHPDEFTIRLIERAVLAQGPDRPVRLDRLEGASEACRRAALCGEALTRTLHGCVLSLSASGLLSIRREQQRRRGTGSDQHRAARSPRDDAAGQARP